MKAGNVGMTKKKTEGQSSKGKPLLLGDVKRILAAHKTELNARA